MRNVAVTGGYIDITNAQDFVIDGLTVTNCGFIGTMYESSGSISNARYAGSK